MTDNDTKSWVFLKGIGGIAAAVITGVLIYYFTHPPTPPQVGLNGFVADAVSQKPIANALVTIDLGPKLATQNTDTQGRYSFVMDGIANQSQAQTLSIDILADGYVHYTTTMSVNPGDNFAELTVQPVSATTAPDNLATLPSSPSAGAPHEPAVHELPHPALIRRAPKNYTMRSDSTALKQKQ